MNRSTSVLFDPIQIGAWKLPNRIVMAPLTRCRASEGRVPNALMAEYYAQRASVGLIISEATSVDPMGVGYPDTPGIWSDAQVEGWKLVTDAVHAKGGRILLQLWHVGRISDPVYLNGMLPVAPSAIAAEGHVSLIRPKKSFVTPRALELDEIPAIVEAYRKGAENAKRAGFDGVELHGANGYLLDQFLQDSTNHRTDEYGGRVENRARLMLEVVDAAISVWGADRVGLHIAPKADSHSMGDSDLAATFGYVTDAMRERGIAFIFARESRAVPYHSPELKQRFGGVFIVNQELTSVDAEQLIEQGHADLAAWGQSMIANPDLVRRFERGLSLNQADSDTFYQGAAKGCTDYPLAADTK
ncbi:alkene reductase [Coraliomargarita sp. SDUM461004]|uniref:Alkene reductase n=1 Tax=Thalassobacterium sedimentorum TaxID=3041258 RepID=A0ABU1AL08_9BACT|nr:alkene reductase [Coraliomargarita sp. SDUM461004]MDQ8195485.1 alkene reductase [Coraliomargarita sp. SDUM461004]